MNRINSSIELKIIVIGNMHTGKTCFVKKWTNGTYTNTYKATIVSEFGSKKVNIDNTLYNVQLWDIAGQDRNPFITRIFSKDCQGALILCEAGDDDSLRTTKEWIDLINQNVKFDDGSDLPYVLVQNKIDLVEHGDMAVNQRKMKEFCDKNNVEKYMSASAKNGYNINEAMEMLMGVIIEKIKICKKKDRKEEIYNSNNGGSIALNGNKEKDGNGQAYDGQKKKCC